MFRGWVAAGAAVGLFMSLATTWVTASFASERIVGGKPVAQDDPIAAVTVGLVWEDVVLCTGVLLDYDLVLTAAHCVEMSQEVVFGTDASSADAPRRRILDKLPHPDFDIFRHNEDPVPSDLFDIAVVRIASPLPLAARPAKLLKDGSLLKDGAHVVIAGYGVDNAANLSGEGPLRKAEVRVLAADYGVTEFKIDASRGSGDCSGDSGGPAYIETSDGMFVAGIDNWGPGLCNEFGVYAKVFAHRAWIERASRELRARSADH